MTCVTVPGKVEFNAVTYVTVSGRAGWSMLDCGIQPSQRTVRIWSFCDTHRLIEPPAAALACRRSIFLWKATRTLVRKGSLTAGSQPDPKWGIVKALFHYTIPVESSLTNYGCPGAGVRGAGGAGRVTSAGCRLDLSYEHPVHMPCGCLRRRGCPVHRTPLASCRSRHRSTERGRFPPLRRCGADLPPSAVRSRPSKHRVGSTAQRRARIRGAARCWRDR